MAGGVQRDGITLGRLKRCPGNNPFLADALGFLEKAAGSQLGAFKHVFDRIYWSPGEMHELACFEKLFEGVRSAPTLQYLHQVIKIP